MTDFRSVKARRRRVDMSGVTSPCRRLCVAALAALLILPAASTAKGDNDDDGPYAGALAASDVRASSARLTGTLEPARGDTTWWIEYGASLNDVKSTAHVVVRGDSNHRPISVSATLTGLSAATQHGARLVATGSGERSDGTLMFFTTAAATAPGTPETPGTPASGEQPPATAGGDDASDPAPVLGETVVAAPAQGTVRVRLPGANHFMALADAASVPVGTVVDAGAGAIELSAALPDGTTQRATFGGARFKVSQSGKGNGRTDLHLRGAGFAGCKRAAGARTLAAVARTRPEEVRRLWGKDRGGRFRTHGRDSVATVRGTAWSMTDRCDGTLTKVTEGAVDVRVRATGRVVRVHAGERHLARHRR